MQERGVVHFCIRVDRIFKICTALLKIFKFQGLHKKNSFYTNMKFYDTPLLFLLSIYVMLIWENRWVLTVLELKCYAWKKLYCTVHTVQYTVVALFRGCDSCISETLRPTYKKSTYKKCNLVWAFSLEFQFVH